MNNDYLDQNDLVVWSATHRAQRKIYVVYEIRYELYQTQMSSIDFFLLISLQASSMSEHKFEHLYGDIWIKFIATKCTHVA